MHQNMDCSIRKRRCCRLTVSCCYYYLMFLSDVSSAFTSPSGRGYHSQTKNYDKYVYQERPSSTTGRLLTSWGALMATAKPNTKSSDDEQSGNEKRRNSSNSNAGSNPKDKVMSALSQSKGGSEPSSGTTNSSANRSSMKNNSSRHNHQSTFKNKGKRRARTNNKRRRSSTTAAASDMLPPLPSPVQPSSNNVRSNIDQNNTSSSRRAPTGSTSSKRSRPGGSLLPPPLTEMPDDDDLVFGLSSWEEFLTSNNVTDSTSNGNKKTRSRRRSTSSRNNSDDDTTSTTTSVKDLFPAQPNDKQQPLSGIRGMENVLPVSELFYRSSQAMTTSDATAATNNSTSNDDEELPFSAEQTSQITSSQNRVQVRRNKAATKKSITSPRNKLVRRGMEMFVGGVPIQADPPQRAMELFYNHYKLYPMTTDEEDNGGDNGSDSTIEGESNNEAWTRTITVNTPEFGPLLSHQGVSKVSRIEQGLFLESFCYSGLKWDILPENLQTFCECSWNKKKDTDQDANGAAAVSYSSLLEQIQQQQQEQQEQLNDEDDLDECESADDDGEGDEADAILTCIFGLDTTTASPLPSSNVSAQDFLDDPNQIFECQFGIKVPASMLLHDGGDAFQNLVIKAIVLVAKTKLLADDFTLKSDEMKVTDMEHDDKSDTTTTSVAIKFHFDAEGEEEDLMTIAESIQPVLMQATNDGTLCSAMVELLEEEDEDNLSEWQTQLLESLTMESESKQKSVSERKCSTDGPLKNDQTRDKDDLYLGNGNGGVFFDYSESNKDNAPFQGTLGPLLVDAVVERAKQRQPRVIAIGDVHGCIDELQDLLRLCDYQPGDLVCFLGDLVCKGPDSVSVVQMAREIGAIGVRGNHDFEVIRWYQAIKSGVDPPVIGSEHFHLASCLGKADMKWLYSLPWYISSKDLGALFVHAGFVAGIRLAKQNPRLMMNVRSILPDGTVTSKFFSNWPWARLWDGPQTVLFGHDADRGLQQYEHAIGLDTGCVYGGRLTACILPEKRLVSVSARREYFKYRRRHYD